MASGASALADALAAVVVVGVAVGATRVNGSYGGLGALNPPAARCVAPADY